MCLFSCCMKLSAKEHVAHRSKLSKSIFFWYILRFLPSVESMIVFVATDAEVLGCGLSSKDVSSWAFASLAISDQLCNVFAWCFILIIVVLNKPVATHALFVAYSTGIKKRPWLFFTFLKNWITLCTIPILNYITKYAVY